MKNIIEFKEVNKSFGKLKAVNNMNLIIPTNTIFGLLGPNGAGKSTLINTLIGLINKDSGKILFKGKEINSNENWFKKTVGYVPQEIAIYPRLTVYENVSFFGSLYGLKKNELQQRVIEALSFVGLENKQKQLAKNLSGGMKRRLNIACAIVHQPELIIMDEPTVGVDPQSRNHILNSIKLLNQKGSTIIYVTHYMEEVESICDKTAIIDEGRVIAKGTIESLQDLISEYTHLLITVDDTSKINNQDLLMFEGVINVLIEDNIIKLNCDKKMVSLSPIIDGLRSLNLDIISIDYQRPSLELVFLTLTGKNLRDQQSHSEHLGGNS